MRPQIICSVRIFEYYQTRTENNGKLDLQKVNKSPSEAAKTYSASFRNLEAPFQIRL